VAVRGACADAGPTHDQISFTNDQLLFYIDAALRELLLPTCVKPLLPMNLAQRRAWRYGACLVQW
jgi:hypothetical protein